MAQVIPAPSASPAAAAVVSTTHPMQGSYPNLPTIQCTAPYYIVINDHVLGCTDNLNDADELASLAPDTTRIIPWRPVRRSLPYAVFVTILIYEIFLFIHDLTLMGLKNPVFDPVRRCMKLDSVDDDIVLLLTLLNMGILGGAMLGAGLLLYCWRYELHGIRNLGTFTWWWIRHMKEFVILVGLTFGISVFFQSWIMTQMSFGAFILYLNLDIFTLQGRGPEGDMNHEKTLVWWIGPFLLLSSLTQYIRNTISQESCSTSTEEKQLAEPLIPMGDTTRWWFEKIALTIVLTWLLRILTLGLQKWQHPCDSVCALSADVHHPRLYTNAASSSSSSSISSSSGVSSGGTSGGGGYKGSTGYHHGYVRPRISIQLRRDVVTP